MNMKKLEQELEKIYRLDFADVCLDSDGFYEFYEVDLYFLIGGLHIGTRISKKSVENSSFEQIVNELCRGFDSVILGKYKR